MKKCSLFLAQGARWTASRFRLALAVALVGVVTSSARCQTGCAGSLDTSFHAGSGVSPAWGTDRIKAIVAQPDGKILVAGNFSSIQNQYRSGLARLNADGMIDPSFTAPVESGVWSIALQPDGKVMVAGPFGWDGPNARLGLGRLNADGSHDATFNPAGDFLYATAVALDPGGGVFAGVAFEDPHTGHILHRVICLANDGSMVPGWWNTFSFEEPIFSLLPGADHSVVVNGILRLGAGDAVESFWRAFPEGFKITCALRQPDGKTLVAGGVPDHAVAEQVRELRQAVVRLNQDGTLDTTFNTNLTFGLLADQWTAGQGVSVNSLSLQPDGRIYVGGFFTAVNGLRRQAVARLLPDGALDAGFETDIEVHTGHDPGIVEIVSAQGLTPDGKLVIGGFLEYINGVRLNSLARLHTAEGGCAGVIAMSQPVYYVRETGGAIEVEIERRANASQAASALLATASYPSRSSSFYYFTYATSNVDYSVTATTIAFAPGETRQTVSIPILDDAAWESTESFAVSLHPIDDGAALANEALSSVVMIWDDESAGYPGSVDETFSDARLNGTVTSLARAPDGTLLVAGNFSQIGGASRTGLARIQATGELVGQFNPIIEGTLRAVAVEADTGRVLIAGGITRVNGHIRHGLARLNPDGTLDEAFHPEVEGEVWQVALQKNGQMIIGGPFNQVSGHTRHGLARLNRDSSVDPEFDAGAGIGAWTPYRQVQDTAVQADGRIVLCGDFSSFSGETHHAVVRLNPDGSLDSGFNPTIFGVADHCSVAALQPDGRILVGGWIRYGLGVYHVGVVRLHPDGSLDTSFVAKTRPEPAALLLQPDGKILCGGNLRLNPDGSEDTSYFTGSGIGYGGASAMVQLPDGDVILGGSFSLANGYPCACLARLNGDRVPLTISKQPVSQTRFVGQTAAFSVQASGTPPLVYQWLFDGLPVPSATNETLVLPGIQFEQTGEYAVVVSHSGDSVTSATARLTVLPVPTGPGSVDITFDVTAGGERLGVEGQYYGGIYALDVTREGQLVIGGHFVGINGVPRYRLARIAPDGSLDRNFMSWGGVNGQVYSVICQPDGKVLIVGEFTEVNGVPRGRMARLHPDGTLDDSYAPQLPPSLWGGPRPILLLEDGKMLVGVNWSDDAYVIHLRLLRLNSDGSVDGTFQPRLDVTDSAHSQLLSLAAQPDGKILVGYFDRAANTILKRLWPDGGLDDSFNAAIARAGEGLCSVADMVVQPDGRIIALGKFEARNAAGAVVGRNFARLYPDGSVDESFHANVSPYGDVRLRLLADGRILVGGSFYIDWDWHCLTRFDPDGSVDPSFSVDEYPWRYTAGVEAMDLLADGRIVAAMQRHASDNFIVDRRRLEIFHPDGSLDDTLDLEMNAVAQDISVILPQPDGKVLLGGDFVSIANTPRYGVARLNVDGSLDIGFEPPMVHAGIKAMALLPNEKILLATGEMASGPGIAGSLARLHPDGALDESFGANIANGQVHVIVPRPDGHILVGGEFRAGDQECLARLRPDGSLDPTFNSGGSGIGGYDLKVAAIAIQTDGKILIGGEFYSYNGAPIVGLARLNPDGSLDDSFGWPYFGYTAAICVQPDNKILISGYFRESETGPRLPRLMRLLADGSLDPSFHAPEGAGGSLALQPDGKILVAGNFYEGSDELRRRGLIRLNPDGSLDTTFDVWGADAPVVLLPNGQVLVGIQNNFINGIPMSGVARLNTDVTGLWATRQLPGIYRCGQPLTVCLETVPVPGVAVYAVEDRAPAGWSISSISHGGVFDALTGKVKFGPFYDDDRRTLSYQVTPALDAAGIQCFEGLASADGVTTPIGGASCVLPALRHPADTQAPEWSLSIGEVTAYGAAWRRGEDWPQGPAPIPIDYATRAGMLWRGGECYELDAAIASAPLWWVNCPTPPTGNPLRPASAGPAEPSVVRCAPGLFVVGEPVSVSLTVTPGANGLAYAVEERLPAGLPANQISQGGFYDAASGVIRWGPFLDAVPRQLNYVLQVVPGGPDTLALSGRTSFDGTGIPITGAHQMRASCRLEGCAFNTPGRLELMVSGHWGGRLAIEVSDDLKVWTLVGETINETGRIEIHDPAGAGKLGRFYRARVLE